MTETLPTGPFYTAPHPNRELDITERLHLMEGGKAGPYPRDETLRLARQIIESLRKEVAGCHAADCLNAPSAKAEIERLRAALKDLFLLACTSNDIRPDCKQMREAGQLLAALEQGVPSSGLLPDGVKLGEFKPCVIYSEELRLTEVLLEDAPTVWSAWGPYKGHAVDCGYAMDDGRLVGVKIWDDVRTRPDTPKR